MLEASPIAGTFAREVRGLALWEPLPDETRDALRAVWSECGVLVFRRQALSAGELVAFSRRFGEPDIIVREDWQSAAAPEVINISNLRDGTGRSLGGLGAGELDWHSDQSYVAHPATGSVLYLVEMPPEGGRTYWANLALALAALPADLRRAIEGRSAVYDYLKRQSGYDDEAPMSDELRARTPPVTHPLVNRDPRTGREAIYLDPSTAVGVEGLDCEAGEALLRRLVRHLTEPRFVYAHAWEPGDVVMWDNAFLMHRRDGFDARHPRLLKRTTLRLDPAHHIVPPGAVLG